MLRSMYTAISGLRAHQFKMDVIGNNIANVNTVGFKKSQTSFQEVFNQTTSGASAPQGGRGGMNPQQVGLGVAVGSVRVIHEPGSAQRTDNPLDFYVGGDGYFTVSGDSNFNNKYYTRAGNFNLDVNGTLVTGEGLKVLGYKVEGDKVSDTLSDIKIDKSNTVPPTATENMKLKGNLDSRVGDGEDFVTDTVIYDSLGNPYTATFKVTKTADSEWTVGLSSVKDSKGTKIVDNEDTPVVSGTLTFDEDGKLVEPLPEVTLTVPDANGGKFIDPIKIDISGLTQYGNDTTAKAYKEDGNTSGTIDSFSVSKSGEIVAVYTNGESKTLAQVALAKFDNPGGLSKEGSNLFKDTRNSGEPQFGKAGGSGYGQMLGGAVEMSNVDLSNEFTEMITTQRGFQANSRVITTSDEILQELVNLKR